MRKNTVVSILIIISLLVATTVSSYNEVMTDAGEVGSYIPTMSVVHGENGVTLVVTDTRTGSFRTYKIGLGDGEQVQIKEVTNELYR